MRTIIRLNIFPLCVASLLGTFASCQSVHDDTVRARAIEIVDEAGRVRMRLGTEMWHAPSIELFNEEGEALASLALARPKDADGTTKELFILHAEVGDGGLFTLGVDSDGVVFVIGPDEQDSLRVRYTKGSLTATAEPAGFGFAVMGPDGTSHDANPKKVEGVRLTLEGGRIVVRDLAGREVGTLGTATVTTTTPAK